LGYGVRDLDVITRGDSTAKPSLLIGLERLPNLYLTGFLESGQKQ